MESTPFEQALEKGARAERLSEEQALALIEEITPDRLHAIGRSALSNRRHRCGETATYVFNLQINPANICGAGCTFCNYAASRHDPHAYVMSEDEILKQVDTLRPTEAHIVGGLNQVWPYERNLELVRQLRRSYPDLHIKAFTAVEIAYFAKTSHQSEQQVLEALKDAGVDALPGGGAEIFSERLHRQHWKNKIGPSEWVHIHRLAHNLGLSTNATMLFGFGDTWNERIHHMLTLRRAQDASKQDGAAHAGFACFIPLAFQPGPGRFITYGPTPLETLMVLGIARLVLDNIDHLKSYWPMSGVATSAAGLSWGADDMDGTISEEKIAHLAGATTPKGVAREWMVETITLAGFVPRERDGRFNLVPNVA